MWREVNKVVLILIWLIRVSSMKCLSCIGKDLIVCLSNKYYVESSNCCMSRDPCCCIILCLVIGSVVLKLLRSWKEIQGVGNLWRCQHHGVKGAWSHGHSYVLSRTWTVFLTGAVVNSHWTSKDTMIWLLWINYLTRVIEDEMQWVFHHECWVISEGKWDVLL